MDGGVSEQLIKQVAASTAGSCSACKHDYDESSVSVLGHQEDLWFLALTCHHCQARGLVAALVNEPAPLVRSDLVPGERTRFWNAPRVVSDDVLSVHQFLDGFDGNFKALFEST